MKDYPKDLEIRNRITEAELNKSTAVFDSLEPFLTNKQLREDLIQSGIEFTFENPSKEFKMLMQEFNIVAKGQIGFLATNIADKFALSIKDRFLEVKDELLKTGKPFKTADFARKLTESGIPTPRDRSDGVWHPNMVNRVSERLAKLDAPK